MKKVTVIIPNYNGLKFMEPCFAALERQNYRDFDILVVDNGSEDGSAQWLREREIPTLFMGENTGFSGAVNAGIRAVSTPYVILLNNDTEPFPDYVGELVRCMDRFPDVFSASSKMIQLYRKDLMDDAGDMYSILGWAYQRQALHAAAEGFGDFPLVGKHGRQIQLQILGQDTGLPTGLGFVVNLGGVEQGFGGNAAPVQAGAAHLPPLHNGGAQAQLGRLEGGGIAAGPGADDKQLVMVHFRSPVLSAFGKALPPGPGSSPPPPGTGPGGRMGSS